MRTKPARSSAWRTVPDTSRRNALSGDQAATATLFLHHIGR